MDIKRAIELLETHNKWRRSEDLNPMVNPTDLGKCIDVIVEHFKNNSVLDDVISCKNCGSDKTKLIVEKRILCNDCVCSYYL